MKKFKKVNVWMLALAVLILTLAVPRAYGANGIDTSKTDCSISFQLDGQYKELNDLPIPVKLYRVADAGADGSYTPLAEVFASLDFSSISSETTAEDWERLADQASELVKTSRPAAAAETVIQKQPEQESASGLISDLSTGLYLVEAEPVQSDEYQFTFQPYLAALPSHYYYSEAEDDTWVYDIETALKPERQDRFGRLKIEKDLAVYNETMGEAHFVFQIEAEKDSQKVYSEVEQLVFRGPGTDALVIDKIPAGAHVTVTEMNTGSAYKVVGSHVIGGIEIRADQESLAHFENTYDDHPNSGSGIVNHFQYTGDGKWDGFQEKEHSGDEQEK